MYGPYLLLDSHDLVSGINVKDPPADYLKCVMADFHKSGNKYCLLPLARVHIGNNIKEGMNIVEANNGEYYISLYKDGLSRSFSITSFKFASLADTDIKNGFAIDDLTLNVKTGFLCVDLESLRWIAEEVLPAHQMLVKYSPFERSWEDVLSTDPAARSISSIGEKR
jgi:hypothetical protein